MNTCSYGAGVDDLLTTLYRWPKGYFVPEVTLFAAANTWSTQVHKLFVYCVLKFGWQVWRCDDYEGHDKQIHSKPELSPTGQHVKQLKTLYGLKRWPRLWYPRLKKFLISKAWNAPNLDSSIFRHSSGPFITVYFDDISTVRADNDRIIAFKKVLAAEFEMIDLGACTYYLTLHVITRPEGICLHEANFI